MSIKVPLRFMTSLLELAMNKRWALLLLAGLLAACSDPNAITGNRELKVASYGEVSYIQNQVVVGYSDEAQLQELVASKQGRVISRIPELGAALVELPGDAWKAARELSTFPGIRYAEPNRANVKPPRADPIEKPRQNLVAPLGNPEDQMLDKVPQYALDPRHLNAQVAWDLGVEGQDVVVGIVDDPSDLSHPDLAANWAGKAYDPLTDTEFTDAAAWVAFASQNPDNSHGTFVASTVAAPRNDVGIAGLAPKAKIMPVAIFQPNYVGDFYVAKGVVWATNNGAQVLNNSWGGSGYGIIVKTAFDYALSKGVVVVASAGNDYNDEIRYPAGYPGIIPSGAASGDREKTYFSSFGRHISTVAPGQDVLLANPTWLGGGYGLISGTSFSGPYTAAAAALVLGACPEATPYQVRRIIEETADSSVGTASGFDRQTGHGHIDAGALARRLKSCDLPEAGAVALVAVFDGEGEVGIQTDVILRGQGFRAGSTTDPTPVYFARTDEFGAAWFYQISPGQYDVYVAGSDLLATGGDNESRGVYVGKLDAVSGSSAQEPVAIRVDLDSVAPGLYPEDPYEPNDSPSEAKELALGERSQLAYIYDQPRDFDWFKFEAKAGGKYQARVYAMAALAGNLDSYLTVYGPDGQSVISFNDDSGLATDSTVRFTAPTDGTYYLAVTSFSIAVNEEATDDNPENRYRVEVKIVQ